MARELAVYRSSTFADNTAKTYRTHLKSYLDFCSKMAIPPVPVTERSVALFATYLARRLKPSSTRQYLNIVRLLHLESGLPNPLQDSWMVKSTLRGIDRVKGCEVVRKAPITPTMLLEMRQRLNFSKSPDCVFWGACLLMFFGLLRKSNLFANGAKSFDPKRQLTRDCFHVDAQARTLSVMVTWSKNNQFKERKQLINLPALTPHPLCPVTAIAQAFQLSSPKTPKAQAFPMTSQNFYSKLKTLLPESQQISSHSFRRGGATWALSVGVPGEIIKSLGDWHSTAYLSYLDQVPQDIIDFYRRKCCAALPV